MFGGLQGSSRAAAGETGCPWARAAPGTPRRGDNCLRALPTAAGRSAAQHGRNGHVDLRGVPWILCGAKSLRTGSALSWLRLPERGERAVDPRLHRCHAASPPGTVTAVPTTLSLAQQPPMQSSGCPSVVIWSRDTRAGTQAHSPSAQRPQNSKASCQVWVVFPRNASPGSLPMTRLLRIPTPARAEGTGGTPRICRAHHTQLNHREGCGVTCPDQRGVLMRLGKKVAMVILCFACRAGRAAVSHCQY